MIGATYSMSVLIGVWVDLRLSPSLLLLLLLLLLSLARGFLPLLSRILLRLQESFFFLSFLKLSFLFGVHFLLFEPLLSSCCSFCPEILHFLFLLRHLNLSFLLLDDSLHLGLLHEASVRHQRPMADSCSHVRALGHGRTRHCREVRSRV